MGWVVSVDVLYRYLPRSKSNDDVGLGLKQLVDGRVSDGGSTQNRMMSSFEHNATRVSLLHGAENREEAQEWDITLVSASHDGTASAWNAVSGNLICHLVGHQGRLNGAKPLQGTEYVITFSDDQMAVVWDISTG